MATESSSEELDLKREKKVTRDLKKKLVCLATEQPGQDPPVPTATTV